MDTSAAARAQGTPYIDKPRGRGLEGGATVVAPADAVQAARQSRHTRDGHKPEGGSKDPDGRPDDEGHDDKRRDNSGQKSQDSQPEVHPTPPAPPPLLLQAVDPQTGQVFWQAPLPADSLPDGGDPYSRLHDSGSNAGPGTSKTTKGSDGEDDAASAELMVKIAYSHQDEDDDRPHVIRTA